MEEEEATTRMQPDELAAAQPALQPAPLPNFVEVTPPVPTPPVASPAKRGRFAKLGAAKLGAALFAAGILVGVVSAVVVMRGGAAQVSPTPSAASVASRAPAALTSIAEPAQPLPPPPVASTVAPPEPKAASTPPAPPSEVKREVGPLTIPSFDAPTCQKLLGDSYYSPRKRQASQMETQVGNRQLLRGNVALAHKAYCRALVWDRKNADRHVNLAKLYLVRRDWEKAAQFGQSALALDAKNKKALGTLADALAALHQTEKARDTMLRAEGKSQATPRELTTMVKRNLALAQRVARMNDFRSAERLYRRVLLLEPEQTDAMKGIASCLLKANEFQAAASWARRAEELKRGT